MHPRAYIEWAIFRCVLCEKIWLEELPPLWTGYDCWPECCDVRAWLRVVIDGGERILS